MSSPPTAHAVRPPTTAARAREAGGGDGRLSAVQVAAGALAAVSAAVLASLFGVAGTVLGAALGSVISTVGAAVYSAWLLRTHARLRRARRRRNRRPGTGPTRPAGTAGLAPLPARLDPRRPPARWRWRRRGILAGTAVGIFVLAMGVVTGVELIGREPVSALVGGSGHSATTTLGTLTQGLGGGQPRSTPPTSGTPGSATSPGSPAASAASSATAASTAFECAAEEDPRSSTALPDFRHSAAASIVTFGRAS
jgi:hypothetical protein